VVTRFACSTGHHVTRRFGWDCHGLPVEFEIDKKLGIKGKEDVLRMGIDKYNEVTTKPQAKCLGFERNVFNRKLFTLT
jgi:isoleucyl-tRNA synthetase